MEKAETIKYVLRIDKTLKEKLEKEAVNQGRSLNGHINYLLKTFADVSETQIIIKPNASRFQKRLDDYMDKLNEGK